MFVNLTPHAVTIFDHRDEVVLTIPASGTAARLSETYVDDGQYRTMVSLGEPIGLPDPVDGTTYIVSMPFLMGALAAGIDRPDCRYPYGQVRDSDGRIIGCRSLARLSAAIPETSTPDYGPNADAVIEIINRAARLTAAEIDRLAGGGQEDLRVARDVVWDACDSDIRTRCAGAAREAAGRAAWDSVWAVAGPVTDAPGDYQRRADAYCDKADRAKLAAANAALATATVDLIPAATADALTAKWREVIPADQA